MGSGGMVSAPQRRALIWLPIVALIAAAALVYGFAQRPHGAATPDAAVAALIKAVDQKDNRAIAGMFAPEVADPQAAAGSVVSRFGGRLDVTRYGIEDTASDAMKRIDLSGRLDGHSYHGGLWLKRVENGWLLVSWN